MVIRVSINTQIQKKTWKIKFYHYLQNITDSSQLLSFQCTNPYGWSCMLLNFKGQLLPYRVFYTGTDRHRHTDTLNFINIYISAQKNCITISHIFSKALIIYLLVKWTGIVNIKWISSMQYHNLFHYNVLFLIQLNNKIIIFEY